jgi:hypothetical protein
MSEYQYYEFQAIDRPLTTKEMNALRSYSTRARITPTSFINDYAWGSFKGDEDEWMERYFDAFLYIANWGTRILKLRLPIRLLDSETAGVYCSGDSAAVREKADKVILSFVSQDEEGGEWIEGEECLSSLISVRAELSRGDLRTLYLGWLLCAQAGEFDDEEMEPPVPPGLRQLSASLESLAEFLRIDRDLLHVAAEASQPMVDLGIDSTDVRAWVARLSPNEKDGLITELILRSDQTQVAELQQRFLKDRAVLGSYSGAPGRTVGQLLRAAEAYTTERKRIQAGSQGSVRFHRGLVSEKGSRRCRPAKRKVCRLYAEKSGHLRRRRFFQYCLMAGNQELEIEQY